MEIEIQKPLKTIKLRQAISAVVFKEDKFLMVAGKDWPEGAWCFPQGGINLGETHFETVVRELKEELGTDNFRILSKSKIDHMYLFPDKIREKKGCEGQFQTIWFVEFLGEFNDIVMDSEELSKYAWFEKDKIIENMMYKEQKEVFERILNEWSKLREDKIF